MTIREAMHQEFRQKDLFELAGKYAFEYLDTVFDRNIYPSDKALEELKNFDEDMPRNPCNAHEILGQLHRFGSPATTAQTGGRYFGFVNGGIVPAALAVKWLTDFWDQNTAMEVMSPIASKLETVVEKWLWQLFGLPEGTAAGFVTGSSAAIYCGLAAARYRLFERAGWDVNKLGLYGAPKIRVITGRHTHSTVLKAINLLGFGSANIEWAEVDAQGSIIPESMPVPDEKTIVILQAGNVNSGAFDPIETICRKAKAAGAWVHVDGAFGMWAAVSERLRHLSQGLALAQSWSTDGHKTLNTPYDCGIVLCADREALVSALHMNAAYLAPGSGRDGMFYTADASRRARIMELWAALKYLGKKGLDELVWGLHERAAQFASELTANGFEVLNDVVFNQVLVACEDDETTVQVLKKVQELRVCWCGGSSWFGRKVIRVSVCSWATTPADVSRSVKSFAEAKAMATPA